MYIPSGSSALNGHDLFKFQHLRIPLLNHAVILMSMLRMATKCLIASEPGFIALPINVIVSNANNYIYYPNRCSTNLP